MGEPERQSEQLARSELAEAEGVEDEADAEEE